MGVAREELSQARIWEVREGPGCQVEGTTRLKAVSERGVKVCIGTEIGRGQGAQNEGGAGVRDLTGLGHVGLIDSE